MSETIETMAQPIGDIDWGAIILSGLLLLPFFAWGLYTLRLRFLLHHELHPAIEAATLVGVLIFFLLEFRYVERAVGREMGLYVLALTGLYISGAALYGHMVISLLSHVIMGSILPSRHDNVHTPAYGTAEAMEEAGDFAGAVREYTFITRTFPRDHRAQIRLADNLERLGRHEESALWFEKAFNSADGDENCLQIVNRLFEIYYRRLDRLDDAERILEDFLDKYPDSPYSDKVSRRLSKLEAGGYPSTFDFIPPPSAESSNDDLPGTLLKSKENP